MGESVVGCRVGDTLGCALVGSVARTVGCSVGNLVGTVGFGVGSFVGTLVGTRVGGLVGLTDGTKVGSRVGFAVGSFVGCRVGPGVGSLVGLTEGSGVGNLVGPRVGSNVGRRVGVSVGLRGVGEVVGFLVMHKPKSAFHEQNEKSGLLQYSSQCTSAQELYKRHPPSPKYLPFEPRQPESNQTTGGSQLSKLYMWQTPPGCQVAFNCLQSAMVPRFPFKPHNCQSMFGSGTASINKANSNATISISFAHMSNLWAKKKRDVEKRFGR